MEEFLAMLDKSIDNPEGPVVIRIPGGKVCHQDTPVNTDFTKYDIIENGEKVALIAEGPFLSTAKQAAAIMREKGVTPTVINPRILSEVDAECLDSLKDYRHVITIEDGIVDGGFGQKVAAYLGESDVKVTCLGLKKEFLDRFKVSDLLKANNLTPEQIAKLAQC